MQQGFRTLRGFAVWEYKDFHPKSSVPESRNNCRSIKAFYGIIGNDSKSCCFGCGSNICSAFCKQSVLHIDWISMTSVYGNCFHVLSLFCTVVSTYFSFIIPFFCSSVNRKRLTEPRFSLPAFDIFCFLQCNVILHRCFLHTLRKVQKSFHLPSSYPKTY